MQDDGAVVGTTMQLLQDAQDLQDDAPDDADRQGLWAAQAEVFKGDRVEASNKTGVSLVLQYNSALCQKL